MRNFDCGGIFDDADWTGPSTAPPPLLGFLRNDLGSTGWGLKDEGVAVQMRQHAEFLLANGNSLDFGLASNNFADFRPFHFLD